MPVAVQKQALGAVAGELADLGHRHLDLAAFGIVVKDGIVADLQGFAGGKGPPMAQAPVAGVAGAVQALPGEGDQAGQGEVFLFQQFLAGDLADGFALDAGFTGGLAQIAVAVAAGLVAVAGVAAVVGAVAAAARQGHLLVAFGGAVKAEFAFHPFQDGHQYFQQKGLHLILFLHMSQYLATLKSLFLSF